MKERHRVWTGAVYNQDSGMDCPRPSRLPPVTLFLKLIHLASTQFPQAQTSQFRDVQSVRLLWSRERNVWELFAGSISLQLSEPEMGCLYFPLRHGKWRHKEDTLYRQIYTLYRHLVCEAGTKLWV